MKNFTVSDARNFLNGKRVFVGDKSADIQTVAMALGYLWGKDPMDVVKHLDKPFLFFTIKENGAWIKSTSDLAKFNKSSRQLVTVDDILGIRIKDGYRYVTAATYLENHKDELKLNAEETSIKEAVREGRMTEAEGKLALDRLHGVQPVAAPAACPVAASCPVVAGMDPARIWALAYERGYADAQARRAYNPVMA